MSKSFTVFWKKNLAFAKLAIQSSTEYRLNFIIDCWAQPLITVGIECMLWYSLFNANTTSTTLGGFSKEYYLAYAIWAVFIARAASNWQYEFEMINNISSGALNSILVRPISFFETYLSQFIGYKILTGGLSFIIPLSLCWFLDLPMMLERLPLVFILILFYLFFVYMLSFIISTLAFHLTKINGLTITKNLFLIIFTGEIVPFDLFPIEYRSFFLNTPFANAAYIPVGYLTGRFDIHMYLQGFLNLLYGILFLAPICVYSWKKGIKNYVGTGA